MHQLYRKLTSLHCRLPTLSPGTTLSRGSRSLNIPYKSFFSGLFRFGPGRNVLSIVLQFFCPPLFECVHVM